MLQEFLSPRIHFNQADEILDPAIFRKCAIFAIRLIAPMCCHPSFSCIMHFSCANLNFNLSVHRANHAWMNRPIAIAFWGWDIIFEPPHHHRISAMYQAKCFITIFFAWHDQTKAHHISQMFHCDILRLHFAPNWIRWFTSTKYLTFNAALIHHSCQLLTNARDNILCLISQKFKARNNGLPHSRVKNQKASIF